MEMLQKKTGWESFADRPHEFCRHALNMKLESTHANYSLSCVRDGADRLGLVWDGDAQADNMADLAVAVLVWRAVTQGRASMMLGGRRSIAERWLTHAVHLLSNSCTELQRDVNVVKDREGFGLRTCTGVWILRYNGALPGDYGDVADRLQHFDVLIGDLAWLDRGLQRRAAEACARDSDALTIMVIGNHVHT